MPRPSALALEQRGRTLRRAALGSGGELYWTGDVSKGYPAAKPRAGGDLAARDGNNGDVSTGERGVSADRETNKCVGSN